MSTAGKMRNGIIKRGTTYSYVVRARDPASGKTKPRWVGGFETHDKAVEARDTARVEARKGEDVTRSRDTLATYLLTWIEQIDVKPKTRSGYRYNVEHYVIPRLGGTVLQDIRPATLTAFYAALRLSGGRGGGELGWRSVQAVHRTLSTALNAALNAQIVTSNVALRATLPPRPRAATREERAAEEMSVFSPDQLRQFLAAAESHRLGPLFRLAAFTGARRGELLYLRWSDLDVEAAELTIEGSRTLADGQVVEGTTKGGRARIISLDVDTLSALRAHRKAQMEEQLAAGPLWDDGGDYLFRTVRGLPIHLDTASSLMPKLCRAVDLPVLRFHDLRHTHASILLSAGVPPHEVAERLGHRDATITLQVYAKVLRERSKGLGDAFAAAVQPGA